MTDESCCPPEAGNEVCESPQQDSPARAAVCPVCGQRGKPVQGQTVKALLSVSLRQVQSVEYLFCKTHACPVVYFSADNEHTFTVAQVRERVFQKEPDADDVFVCYCFRHTVGDIRSAASDDRAKIVDNINAGIKAEQCACDLRNPQGSCCLGNVGSLIKQLEKATMRA